MTRRYASLVFAGLIALSGTAGAMPVAQQTPKRVLENNWKTCEAAVGAAEAQAGIPKHLLTAISQAESGRWHPEKQANIAWPWTVTANGKGLFFDSKAEAMAEAEILITQGVRNIDVGCMQVNLMYHYGAFDSLAKAFDPVANAKYGAKYLKEMHARTRDWREAAAHYHSTTPEQAARYRAKVLRLWDQARRPQLVAHGARTAPQAKQAEAKDKLSEKLKVADKIAGPDAGKDADKAKAGTEPDRARPSAIDFGLMQRLNASFQDRLEEKTAGEELAEEEAQRAHLRREQLDAWRERKAAGATLLHLANMRRAELAQRRRKELSQVSAAERADKFADKRRSQLESWRAHRVEGDTIYYTGDTPLPFKPNAGNDLGS